MKHWVRTVLEEATSANARIPEHIFDGMKRIVQLVEGSDVYHFRTDELEGIADEILECDDLVRLSELMWRAVTSCGFQNFVIFVMKQGNGGPFRPRVCTSYNERWLARYQDKNYQYVDPIMVKAMTSPGAFLYSDIEESSAVAGDFWQDAKAHSIGTNGVCYPFERADGARIGVSFSSGNSAELVRQTVALNGSDLQVIAEIATDCFCYLARGTPLGECQLDVDELRFLHILASHANPEEAKKLSAKYGSNHALQVSIRRKMGVASVYQAVAIATARGWFDELPYDADEVSKPFPALRYLEAEGFAEDEP